MRTGFAGWRCIVGGALWLIMCGSVSAQTFYVATSGNDLPANGSAQNPWQSISYAFDQVPDGATILVSPGLYSGRVRLDRQFNNGITIRSSQPYQARLRHNDGAVVICYTCAGVTLEGFDIAHAASNTGALVIQIQTTQVSRVTLRNNIIHDSTNNDLLKINNGARDVLVEGNMFYNQQGSDEHIDVNSVENVTIRDNVFFNTQSQSSTSSFIVIKDSNGSSDGILGSRQIRVQRNILFNWQGSDGQSFIRVGEDGTANFEAQDVLIENNLLLGNSTRMQRSALTVQGSRDVTFRFNTVVGDLPSRSFAARLLAVGSNQANQNIQLNNNIWSDPSGSMGAEGFTGADVFDAPTGDNASVVLQRNLYFNGGQAIPADAAQEVRFSQDAQRIIANPQLPDLTGVPIPSYNGNAFNGGFASIRAVFTSLVNEYGRPAGNSVVVNAGLTTGAPQTDILGASRDAQPDIGAVEVGAATPPPPVDRGPNNFIPSWLILLLDEAG